jgi:hypothetical protein
VLQETVIDCREKLRFEYSLKHGVKLEQSSIYAGYREISIVLEESMYVDGI